MSQPEIVTAERMRHHVERLAGEIGERNIFRPAALAAAREYIEAEWSEQGYRASFQWYETLGHPCANLEVARGGSSRPEQILVVGAHYDSVRGSPGADDNATGVAALLEISRLFAAEMPSVAVRFVAFVNEEGPFFLSGEQGSMMYARSARARGHDIRLMLSLEMLGYYRAEPGSQRYPPLFRFFYPDRGDFLGFVSDLRSRQMMLRMARLFRAHSGFPLEHVETFPVRPGRRLERSPLVGAPRLPRPDGHGHGLLPQSSLPPRRGHARQARLPSACPCDRRSFRSSAVLAQQGFDPA